MTDVDCGVKSTSMGGAERKRVKRILPLARPMDHNTKIKDIRYIEKVATARFPIRSTQDSTHLNMNKVDGSLNNNPSVHFKALHAATICILAM